MAILSFKLKTSQIRRIILKCKTKKYHNAGTIPKSNSKVVERGKIDRQIHDRSQIRKTC